MTPAPVEAGLSVVMYHYVRPIAMSLYPGIRGLEFDGFLRQLDYLTTHFDVVGIATVTDHVDSGVDFDRPTALLTFDDGFIDHYLHVLPALHERGLTGAFYPPSRPVLDHELLDVHRLHFVLATQDDLGDLEALCRSLMSEHLGGKAVDALFSEAATTRFDSNAIVVIKRLLQRDLPENVRRDITAALFRQIVSVDEGAFVDALYMSAGHLRQMIDAGMHVGGHSDRHDWLGAMSSEQQDAELSASVAMLDSLGVDTSAGWTLAYPYGSYDDNTLAAASRLGCSLAFTTKVGRSTVTPENRLTLERFDTNDFPQ